MQRGGDRALSESQRGQTWAFALHVTLTVIAAIGAPWTLWEGKYLEAMFWAAVAVSSGTAAIENRRRGRPN
jgi:hypothetical protein